MKVLKVIMYVIISIIGFIVGGILFLFFLDWFGNVATPILLNLNIIESHSVINNIDKGAITLFPIIIFLIILSILINGIIYHKKTKKEVEKNGR